METFSWLVQVLGTPGAWCSIGLQLMKGLLTFWAILAVRQLWEQAAGGGAKKLPLWSPNPPWADGAIWHMVNWPPRKCFSQKSLQNWNHSNSPWKYVRYRHLPEALKLSFDIIKEKKKNSFDPGSWRNRPTYADDPDRLQLWIVVSHQSLCKRPDHLDDPDYLPKSVMSDHTLSPEGQPIKMIWVICKTWHTSPFSLQEVAPFGWSRLFAKKCHTRPCSFQRAGPSRWYG